MVSVNNVSVFRANGKTNHSLAYGFEFILNTVWENSPKNNSIRLAGFCGKMILFLKRMQIKTMNSDQFILFLLRSHRNEWVFAVLVTSKPIVVTTNSLRPNSYRIESICEQIEFCIEVSHQHVFDNIYQFQLSLNQWNKFSFHDIGLNSNWTGWHASISKWPSKLHGIETKRCNAMQCDTRIVLVCLFIKCHYKWAWWKCLTSVSIG